MRIKIPVLTEDKLVARLLRIAQARQGNVRRVLPAISRESFIRFADEEERKEKLKPITDTEVKELLSASGLKKEVVVA